jgi:hypothetical protein
MVESIIISTAAIFIFCMGMVVQKYCFTTIQNDSPRSFMKTNTSISNNKASDIILDEKKVVLKIDTASLEKKTELVGSTKVVQNDTSGAIDKLKNMKGK